MRKSQQPQTLDTVLQALPEQLRSDTPVILICRPASHRQTPEVSTHDGNALWIDVLEPSMLVPLAKQLQQWRSQAPDAVVIGVAPEGASDIAKLQGDMVSWRYVIAAMQHRVAQRIPVYLTLFARLDAGAGPATPAWRGTLIAALGKPQRAMDQVIALLDRLDAPSAEVSIEAPSTVTRYNARAQALLTWARDHILPAFGTTTNGLAPLRLQGILLGNSLEPAVPQHLLGQWFNHRCALAPGIQAGVSTGMPLPLPIVPHLPQPWRCDPWLRGLLHAGALTALAVAVAMAASYWGNARLIRQTRDDIASYRSAGYERQDRKLAALEQLQVDRDQFLAFSRNGVPWRLGWGMYRGETLLPLLEHEIGSYAPPPGSAINDQPGQLVFVR